ncbi:MAG: 5'/3'-nucleotidase SurE [Parachlamydiales bacterium]|jgi:5'-nucleotidase
MNKPNILITNDDGINALGIQHLWKALYQQANVTIVAPLSEKSGSGLSMTLTKPLLIQKVRWEDNTPAFKVNNGTPSDCVKLALGKVLEKKPDLIVSGINHGANSGRTPLYSGTVGAVIEGAMRDIPGIAFSCLETEKNAFATAEKYILPIVSYVLKNPLPPGSFLNVNFPSTLEIRGIKMAKQGLGYWLDNPVERTHPEGHSYYWLSCKLAAFTENEESDVALLEQGYITAVPINVNELTDLKHFQAKKELFEESFQNLFRTETIEQAP